MSVSSKLSYTKNAVNDIEAALKERNIDTKGIGLGDYGELIRSIKSSGGSGGDSSTPSLILKKRVKRQDKIINAKVLDAVEFIPHYMPGYEPAVVDEAMIATLELDDEDFEEEPEENLEENEEE